MNVKTYPAMNSTIKDLLRNSEEPMQQYALARIEELEQQIEAYKGWISSAGVAPPEEEPAPMTDLYVRDRHTGKAHRVGDDHHDSLFVDDKGIVQYHNMQNGDGTLCGHPLASEAGYEFVTTGPDAEDVDDETLRQAAEHREQEARWRQRNKELAAAGIIRLS